MLIIIARLARSDGYATHTTLECGELIKKYYQTSRDSLEILDGQQYL